MELARQRDDFNRRVGQIGKEIQERIEKVERRCKDAAEARRKEWERLEGRVMTAQEDQERRSDEFLRLINAVGQEHLRIVQAVGEDMRQGFAEIRADDEERRAENEESRAQLRANTEAVLKMLDRLSPD